MPVLVGLRSERGQGGTRRRQVLITARQRQHHRKRRFLIDREQRPAQQIDLGRAHPTAQRPGTVRVGRLLDLNAELGTRSCARLVA